MSARAQNQQPEHKKKIEEKYLKWEPAEEEEEVVKKKIYT